MKHIDNRVLLAIVAAIIIVVRCSHQARDATLGRGELHLRLQF
jgi:hypothetical protein